MQLRARQEVRLGQNSFDLDTNYFRCLMVTQPRTLVDDWRLGLFSSKRQPLTQRIISRDVSAVSNVTARGWSASIL